MSARAIFDPGLQPERTELAWRRTALTIAVGSLISMRVLPSAIPETAAWGVVPGLCGLLAASGIWVAARRRQLRVTGLLTGTSEGVAPGGLLLLVLTLLGSALGIVALVFVVLSVLT